MLSYQKKIIICSRGSLLARTQVKIFKEELFKKDKKINTKNIKEVFIKTSGDKYLEKKISAYGDKGLFTKEIDEAQLSNNVDLAIHSLKDLPYRLPDGLVIAGYLKREDYRDALVSVKGRNLKSLKSNSIIGSSSIRREIQLKKIRPDLKIKLIRGNIETRIKKLYRGEYDGILLAMAGLKRLGIFKDVTPIRSNLFVPAIGQGVIAIVAREKDKELISIIKKISNLNTTLEVECERSFLAGFGGSCETPVGAIAKILYQNKKKKIKFRYFGSDQHGKEIETGKSLLEIKNCKTRCYNLGIKVSKNCII